MKTPDPAEEYSSSDTMVFGQPTAEQKEQVAVRKAIETYSQNAGFPESIGKVRILIDRFCAQIEEKFEYLHPELIPANFLQPGWTLDEEAVDSENEAPIVEEAAPVDPTELVDDYGRKKGGGGNPTVKRYVVLRTDENGLKPGWYEASWAVFCSHFPHQQLPQTGYFYRIAPSQPDAQALWEKHGFKRQLPAMRILAMASTSSSSGSSSAPVHWGTA